MRVRHCFLQPLILIAINLLLLLLLKMYLFVGVLQFSNRYDGNIPKELYIAGYYSIIEYLSVYSYHACYVTLY